MTTDNSAPGDDEDLSNIFKAFDRDLKFNKHNLGEMGYFISLEEMEAFLLDLKDNIRACCARQCEKARIDELQNFSDRVVRSGIPVADYYARDGLTKLGRLFQIRHDELQAALQASDQKEQS